MLASIANVPTRRNDLPILAFLSGQPKNCEKIAGLTNSKTLDSEDIEFMYLSDKNCILSARYAFPSTVGITGRDISPHWEFID